MEKNTYLFMGENTYSGSKSTLNPALNRKALIVLSLAAQNTINIMESLTNLDNPNHLPSHLHALAKNISNRKRHTENLVTDILLDQFFVSEVGDEIDIEPIKQQLLALIDEADSTLPDSKNERKELAEITEFYRYITYGLIDSIEEAESSDQESQVSVIKRIDCIKFFCGGDEWLYEVISTNKKSVILKASFNNKAIDSIKSGSNAAGEISSIGFLLSLIVAERVYRCELDRIDHEARGNPSIVKKAKMIGSVLGVGYAQCLTATSFLVEDIKKAKADSDSSEHTKVTKDILEKMIDLNRKYSEQKIEVSDDQMNALVDMFISKPMYH